MSKRIDMDKTVDKADVDTRLAAARKRKAKSKADKSNMKLGKLGLNAITKY